MYGLSCDDLSVEKERERVAYDESQEAASHLKCWDFGERESQPEAIYTIYRVIHPVRHWVGLT